MIILSKFLSSSLLKEQSSGFLPQRPPENEQWVPEIKASSQEGTGAQNHRCLAPENL